MPGGQPLSLAAQLAASSAAHKERADERTLALARAVNKADGHKAGAGEREGGGMKQKARGDKGKERGEVGEKRREGKRERGREAGKEEEVESKRSATMDGELDLQSGW